MFEIFIAINIEYGTNLLIRAIVAESNNSNNSTYKPRKKGNEK